MKRDDGIIYRGGKQPRNPPPPPVSQTNIPKPPPTGRRTRSETVLIIPADPSDPVRTKQIDSGAKIAAIGRLIQGDPERAAYDRDVDTFVLDNGSNTGALPNERATRYAMEWSGAARRSGERGTAYWLYGAVVLTGASGQPLPQRVLDQFGVAAPEVGL